MRCLRKMAVVMNVACTLFMGSFALAEESGDAKSFVIAGAGPSTKVVELLAQKFCAAHAEYTITVPPRSIKHKGGLEWVAKSGRLFGRTGRPLSENERELFPALVELPLARIKTAFAVNRELGVSTLTLEQWTQIYKGTIQNWNEVGGPDQPIILLGLSGARWGADVRL